MIAVGSAMILPAPTFKFRIREQEIELRGLGKIAEVGKTQAG
jgi:hypothetical protein